MIILLLESFLTKGLPRLVASVVFKATSTAGLLPTFLKLITSVAAVVGSLAITPAESATFQFPPLVQTSSFTEYEYQLFHFLPSFPIQFVKVTSL